MNDVQKKELLELYEKIESMYRRYQYAKEVSETSLNEYLKLVQKLPSVSIDKGVDFHADK